jgi:uncharacterized repeat protein (TIGR03803 family)
MRKLAVLSIALVTFAGAAIQAQTYTALYDLGTKSNDPNGPTWPGAIAQGRNGQLYTASPGGGNGKAFSFTTSGAVTLRRSFNGTDGGEPYGGLNLGTDGLYYGATELGGANGLGTVFKMTAGGGLTTLYAFTGASDGGVPWTAPIESAAGAFYGVTRGVYPYTSNYGTVYKITSSGSLTTLHEFTSGDGAWPTGQLVQGKDFYFYGTTQGGGAFGKGTIFRISSSGDFKVLYSFDGATASTPIAGVIQAGDGNFYGTALEPGNGSIYRFSLTKGFSILYAFSGASDGGSPYGGLVQATDGDSRWRFDFGKQPAGFAASGHRRFALQRDHRRRNGRAWRDLQHRHWAEALRAVSAHLWEGGKTGADSGAGVHFRQQRVIQRSRG